MDTSNATSKSIKRKFSKVDTLATSGLSLDTYNQPISPPDKKIIISKADGKPKQLDADVTQRDKFAGVGRLPRTIPSPFRLMHIEGLPRSSNRDTVKLQDILGDPLIKECWAFNYLIDVDFLMGCFDNDVRDLVKVFVIHGSWRKEDSNRSRIEEATSRWKNVKSITAFMPEPYGTHHSKMLVLLRHDDSAQIVILTANFIPRDMRMCQAIWRSPLLPIVDKANRVLHSRPTAPGPRFKYDLLSYLASYGNRLKELMTQLKHYDFSEVRAAFIASTPCKQHDGSTRSDQETMWGWLGLKSILSDVRTSSGAPHIVIQVSSIATLGIHDGWLRNALFNALTTGSKIDLPRTTSKPKFSIVFPTERDIRQCVDGYACGGSIHMKISTPQQKKQLQYLRPMLCRWAGDAGSDVAEPRPKVREAGMRRSGPHIKTYLRFSDQSCVKLDWAMVTSSNLSKQAWGTEPSETGDVRISSYETGVIVWPDLWKESAEDAIELTPVFKTDVPYINTQDFAASERETSVSVGLRMPYDLPIVPYLPKEQPWCASIPHEEPDLMGSIWSGR